MAADFGDGKPQDTSVLHQRWYQQFYVDVADVSADMTDRFEREVDTTHANDL